MPSDRCGCWMLATSARHGPLISGGAKLVGPIRPTTETRSSATLVFPEQSDHEGHSPVKRRALLTWRAAAARACVHPRITSSGGGTSASSVVGSVQTARGAAAGESIPPSRGCRPGLFSARPVEGEAPPPFVIQAYG